jgi:hypothetical protein
MKARGIPSPNRADALALTFAQPVGPALAEPEPERETEYESPFGWMR